MTTKSHLLKLGFLLLMAVTANAQDVGAFNPSVQADERFREFQKSLSARYKQDNRLLLLSDTVTACEKLYADDKVAALVNSVCNNIFMEAKHPNMPSVEEFNLFALRAEYSELSEADREVLRREGLIDLLED